MSTPPNREVALFTAALELPAAEREAYVRKACADDPKLRVHVEALLRAHEEVAGFLATPAGGGQGAAIAGEILAATVCEALNPSQSSGDRIGRYKLLQQIGEGGCGVVYMAEQEEPVRRKVALKVIKLGMDTKQVIARFEAERQALALMDHPNIAKVLDAGATETGRPYFVMELVKGVPVTRYCDEKNLGTKERLGLFIKVCQAIQHAHQKGIIHRDIKPSNVLVADHDGVPVPKIIDFGIAKATTDQRLTDKTMFTALEQFIGTPAYMSPEQANLSGLDIDTRSDIYSLGVLLYELLTGKTPFEAKRLRESGLDEIRRIIREEEPARPSTRLHTLNAAERTSVAKHRQSDPPKLVHLISGDLDWIVMKAMEKDRGRRYETAHGLASDIQRHLNSEPVVARPPGRLYRFQKMVRRNTVAFAATSAVALALVAGLGFSTWSFLGERRARVSEANARQSADEQRRRAEQSAKKAEQERKRAEIALLNAMRSSYEANIYAANDSLNANEIDQTQSRLEACDKSLRNWEWNHLKLKSDGSSLTLDGAGRQGCFAVSPAGQWVAGGFEDGSARLWSFDTGELLWSTSGVGKLDRMVFNGDGSLLATSEAGAPPIVRIWKSNPFEQIAAFALPPEEVATSLAFDNESKTLLVGTGQWLQIKPNDPASGAVLQGKGQIRAWDIAEPHNSRVLGSHDDPISFLGVSGDNKKFVSSSWKATKVWGLDGDRKEPVVLEGGPSSLAVAPKSRKILRLVNKANGSEIIDVLSGEVILRCKTLGEPRRWAMSPGGDRIATAFQNEIQIWDTSRASLLDIRHGLPGSINYLAFGPDGLRMLSSDGQQLKVWDMAQGGSTLKMRPKSPGYTWSATSVMFDTNSDTIIAADTGGTVRLWDTKSGLLESEFLSPGGGIQDVALGGRGGPVALLQGDVVKLWDPRSRRILETLRPSNPVRTLFGKRLSFNPDGAELLYVSANGPQIWRMADGTMRATIKRARQITAAVFSPDGSAIAIAGSGLEMLDAKSLRSLAVLDKETALNCLAFDPAGRQVAAVDGRDILIWDVPARKLRGRLRGREGIQALAFNPDGSRLVCGGGRVDPAIQIWDTVTLKLLLTLRDHVRTVTSIAFSPDGTKFASASLDGSIIAWKSMLPGLSPPPNRARLVASALVERLYEDCLIATNVIRQLERDESLDWEVRHEALRLASLRDDTATADGLNALSWSVVSLPGKEPSAYQAALRQAKAACGLRPEAPFLNTLGVAYYRAGEFENAIATLERADQSNRGTYNRASDLLFIAMGHQKLGRKQKAVDLLKEARSQMEGDGGASGDLVEFAREAGQLIEKSP